MRGTRGTFPGHERLDSDFKKIFLGTHLGGSDLTHEFHLRSLSFISVSSNSLIDASVDEKEFQEG